MTSMDRAARAPHTESTPDAPEISPAHGSTTDLPGVPLAGDTAPQATLCADTPEGARRVFEVLFDRYHAGIYRYIARMLGDADEASDLTQDVFLKAYRTLPQTVARGDFRPEPWLYRIATNACLDALRHRRLIGWCSLNGLLALRLRRRGSWVSEAGEPYVVPGERDGTTGALGAVEVADAAGSGDPQRQALERETAAEVQATLDRLRATHRSVLLLREYHQLSYDEIAHVLGTTRAGVKSLLFRARGEFRQEWSQP